MFGFSYAGDVAFNNAGAIYASGYDSAGAVILALGGAISMGNSGSIAAVSNGDGATYGVTALASGPVSMTNSGSIRAESAGAGDTIGLLASSDGTITVGNSGTITATDADYAIAVSLNGALSTLANTGTLQAHSVVEGEVAVEGGDGIEQVTNQGRIFGALVTNGGDDALVNQSGGHWYVGNHLTDFGSGDDSISNLAGGKIHMSDAAIYLGSSTAAGNSFSNSGLITVSGDNLIDMGTGVAAVPLTTGAQAAKAYELVSPAAVPSLNATALINNGVIDFLDGVPDDVLTIVGDLGGNGAINIDVNIATGASDLLYVDGSIVDSSSQTVNASIVGAFNETMIQSPVAFAYISGNSTSGSFKAGQLLGYNGANFLDLRLAVTSQIDVTNATADVFSLSVLSNGLNDTGSLAASVSAGAHSLANSQIGTWRQRVGVMPTLGEDMVGLSPWIRVFSDKGEVAPTYSTNFGSAGHTRFNQSNWGRELGMNYTLGNGFNYGVLLAKADGTQRLLDGTGTDRLKMNSAGLYATWISQQFYVDGSYRWMDFDADLTSIAGQQRTSGNATAFNVEAGWTAMTLGGVDVIPQAQYTRTKVDNVGPVEGPDVDFTIDASTSERGRLGVGFSKSIDNNGLIWTPYGSVNAVREFDGVNRFSVLSSYQGSTSTEGTSAMVELGLGVQKAGFSATGGVNWTDGGAQKSFVGGQLVLRYTW